MGGGVIRTQHLVPALADDCTIPDDHGAERPTVPQLHAFPGKRHRLLYVCFVHSFPNLATAAFSHEKTQDRIARPRHTNTDVADSASGSAAVPTRRTDVPRGAAPGRTATA